MYGDRNGRGMLTDSDDNCCLFAMYFVPDDTAPLLHKMVENLGDFLKDSGDEFSEGTPNWLPVMAMIRSAWLQSCCLCCLSTG